MYCVVNVMANPNVYTFRTAVINELTYITQAAEHSLGVTVQFKITSLVEIQLTNQYFGLQTYISASSSVVVPIIKCA